MSKEESVGKKFLNWIGGVAAFLTVAVYVVLIIHAKWAFLPEQVLNILAIVKVWAPLIVVGIVGLEFVQDKSFILKLLFLILCAVVVLSMFFPSTWEDIVGIIKK